MPSFICFSSHPPSPPVPLSPTQRLLPMSQQYPLNPPRDSGRILREPCPTPLFPFSKAQTPSRCLLVLLLTPTCYAVLGDPSGNHLISCQKDFSTQLSHWQKCPAAKPIRISFMNLKSGWAFHLPSKCLLACTGA